MKEEDKKFDEILDEIAWMQDMQDEKTENDRIDFEELDDIAKLFEEEDEEEEKRKGVTL